MNELELKRQRIQTLAKIAAAGVISFALAPFVLIAIKGFVGLLIAGVIGVIAINLAPWFGNVVANWRLKAIKHEAAKNPIETLENQYGAREGALRTFRENILAFHAEVENFRSMIQEHKEKYPDDTKFDEKFIKMRQLLDVRSTKYKNAQANLVAFYEFIDRKRSEWKIVQASTKMDKAAGVGEDFINKLMTETANDAVTTGLNVAFAELEVSLLDEAPVQSVVVEARPTLVADTGSSVSLDLGIPDAVEVEASLRSRKLNR